MDNEQHNQSDERATGSSSGPGSARAAGEVRTIEIATAIGFERVTAIVFGAWAATPEDGQRYAARPTRWTVTHVASGMRIALDAAANLEHEVAIAIAQRLDAEVGEDWRGAEPAAGRAADRRGACRMTDLRTQIRPLVAKLADDLAALMERHFAAARDRALVTARAQLEAELDALAAPPAAKPKRTARRRPAPKRKRKGAKLRAALRKSTDELFEQLATLTPEPEPAAEPIAPPTAKPKQVTCTVCGELGHNARRHRGEAMRAEPTPAGATAPAPTTPTAPPSSATKPDRFAVIERLARARRREDLPAAADFAAWDTPCRDPNCRIERLHAAHTEAA